MKDISDLEKDLALEIVQLKQLYENDLPNEAALELEILTDESFRKEKYQGAGGKKWPARKNDKDDYTKKGNAKPRSRRRGLMVQSGELIRSTEASIDKGTDITVSIGSDKVYAQIHNEGLIGKAWGKHPFKMPQRQFMPVPGTEEPAVNKKLEVFIDKNLDRIFK
jgi:phage gpG-like protein